MIYNVHNQQGRGFVQTNIQVSQNVKVVTKKEISLRTLLNLIGIFIFGGLLLTAVTVPVSLNEKMDLSINNALKLDSKELQEFLLFTIGSASIYYFLVNIYFKGGLWRKVFYMTLFLLGCFSLFMVFYLYIHSTHHH